MIKQWKILTLAALLALGTFSAGFAAEKQEEAPVDPAATNMSGAYVALEEAVPPMPVKPASLQDAKAVTAYVAAVDKYLQALQKYVDGTTNDLNKIIDERNKAIAAASKVTEEYNAFFEANKKK